MTVGVAAKLAFLRSPGVLDGAVEAIETHMSWVLLTEHRAFKLKKPVKLPYLDYSTVERRRQCCERELRIGRRLAPGVYREVVPLVATRRGLVLERSLAVVDGDGADGEPEGVFVDWLVVMRRLPDDRMLPQMLARGVATCGDADAVGELLARFYRAAPRVAWSGHDYRHRLRNAVVEAAGGLAVRGASRAQLGAIVKLQLDAIDRQAVALDARIAAGRVVDAHGDLRPEHVCLEVPPLVIDPLEFDDELRMLDAVSELSFFALECERLGATWFGERVIDRYREAADDRWPAALASLYRAQHALTRALIALRHVDDVAPADQRRWRDKADDYLVRAERAVGLGDDRRDPAWAGHVKPS